jgi:hypothetical protein
MVDCQAESCGEGMIRIVLIQRHKVPLQCFKQTVDFHGIQSLIVVNVVGSPDSSQLAIINNTRVLGDTRTCARKH